jgi:hypothetical protein
MSEGKEICALLVSGRLVSPWSGVLKPMVEVECSGE